MPLPPAPLHVSENVVCWFTTIDSEPESGRAPVQPSDATHAVALDEDHVSVVLPPTGTPAGFADRDTDGTGRTLTVV